LNIEEIKELIAPTSFKRDVPTVRAAWIAYGGLLAQCPHTQGDKIGMWVVEQGLDFVESKYERAAAKKLFGIGEFPNANLDDCPYSSPVDVLKWLRKRAPKPESEGYVSPNEAQDVDYALNKYQVALSDAQIAVEVALSAMVRAGYGKEARAAIYKRNGKTYLEGSNYKSACEMSPDGKASVLVTLTMAEIVRVPLLKPGGSESDDTEIKALKARWGAA